MDTQRSSFGSDGGQSLDDPTAEAPGIEAPPLVGQDERRMHVRAYNYWASCWLTAVFRRSKNSIWTISTTSGRTPCCSISLPGIENPAIPFIGKALRVKCDLDGDVQYLDEVPGRSLLSRMTDHYMQIIANQAPIGFEAEYVNDADRRSCIAASCCRFPPTMIRSISSIGVINWKQAADHRAGSGQIEEMEAASAAAHSARPTVPVWEAMRKQCTLRAMTRRKWRCRRARCPRLSAPVLRR